MRRASRFFCDHIRVFSEWATVQELSDIALPYGVTRVGDDPSAFVYIAAKRTTGRSDGTPPAADGTLASRLQRL
ncbi:MAG: hypothetical protein ABSC21_02530 [Terriglobia bacterium]